MTFKIKTNIFSHSQPLLIYCPGKQFLKLTAIFLCVAQFGALAPVCLDGLELELIGVVPADTQQETVLHLSKQLSSLVSGTLEA